VDAEKTVIETSHVGNTTSEPKTAERIAHMSGVGSQYDLAFVEAWGTSLLHFVWVHVDKLVLVRLGMSWEDLFVSVYSIRVVE